MLLPTSELHKIRYYESRSLERTNYEYHDIVVVHYKSFWTRTKTFKFQCIRTTDNGEDVVRTSQNYLELKKQLDEYFQQDAISNL